MDDFIPDVSKYDWLYDSIVFVVLLLACLAAGLFCFYLLFTL